MPYDQFCGRYHEFADIGELKSAVAEKLEEHNSSLLSKSEGTRRRVFEEQEKPLLRSLPVAPYEVYERIFSSTQECPARTCLPPEKKRAAGIANGLFCP